MNETTAEARPEHGVGEELTLAPSNGVSTTVSHSAEPATLSDTPKEEEVCPTVKSSKQADTTDRETPLIDLPTTPPEDLEEVSASGAGRENEEETLTEHDKPAEEGSDSLEPSCTAEQGQTTALADENGAFDLTMRGNSIEADFSAGAVIPHEDADSHTAAHTPVLEHEDTQQVAKGTVDDESVHTDRQDIDEPIMDIEDSATGINQKLEEQNLEMNESSSVVKEPGHPEIPTGAERKGEEGSKTTGLSEPAIAEPTAV